MHIACFYLVVTLFVCINQPWWVFHHHVCVVEHLVHVLWRWCWLCLQSVITMIDDVACCYEKMLMLFELLRDGIIRIGSSDLLSMVCV